MKKIKLFIGGTLVFALLVLGVGQSILQKSSVAASTDIMAPHFLVDPYWPKPLPNMWAMGNTIGVEVDERDHVFIVHRNDASQFGGNTEIGLLGGVSECCTPAPPIIEFDPAGNVVNAWGGPVEGAEYVWPASNHGIAIEANGNIWIGGNGGGDSHVLVFTRNGEYIRTIGVPTAIPLMTAPMSLTHLGSQVRSSSAAQFIVHSLPTMAWFMCVTVVPTEFRFSARTVPS